MYGFDHLAEINLFSEAELIQICIGCNEVILRFYPYGSNITVSNPNVFFQDNTFLLENIINPLKNESQIGKKVLKFHIIDSKKAALAMSDGSEIVFTDDSMEYESVTFEWKGKVMAV